MHFIYKNVHFIDVFFGGSDEYLYFRIVNVKKKCRSPMFFAHFKQQKKQ